MYVSTFPRVVTIGSVQCGSTPHSPDWPGQYADTAPAVFCQPGHWSSSAVHSTPQPSHTHTTFSHTHHHAIVTVSYTDQWVVTNTRCLDTGKQCDFTQCYNLIIIEDEIYMELYVQNSWACNSNDKQGISFTLIDFLVKHYFIIYGGTRNKL